MIYNGKEASIRIREALKESVALLKQSPSLAVISASSHPSIASFIAIKKKFGEAIGAHVVEYAYEESIGEASLIEAIQTIADQGIHTGIIVQLPLPSSYSAKKVLDAIPEHLDVDVLGKDSWNMFKHDGTPIPPVAGAVAYIVNDTNIDITNKNIVIIGQGILVGLPVMEWFKHHNVTPHIVDIDTSEEARMEMYKQADIVITGIGVPHHLKKEFFKDGVVLIDAGTSEQSGVIAGDCDPACADIASIMTPVPGGVGPLTVAHLFKNLIEFAKKRESEK